jgi:hypothetical protein
MTSIHDIRFSFPAPATAGAAIQRLEAFAVRALSRCYHFDYHAGFGFVMTSSLGSPFDFISDFHSLFIFVSVDQWPNQSPEPTAVGDVRLSAGVVGLFIFSGCLWLSFFRSACSRWLDAATVGGQSDATIDVSDAAAASLMATIS